MSEMKALILCCTLKKSPAESSSQLMSERISAALSTHGVEAEVIRVADHDVKFGITTDEGDGDGWPAIRQKMLDSQILVLTTPIWMGQPASMCKVVLERLDAELGEEGDDGLPLTYGKVAVAGIVGNEDGAHHSVAEIFQAVNDCGFTIPAAGCTYWVGEAMQREDYKDLDERPDVTESAMQTMVANAVQLAQGLQAHGYTKPDA